MKETVRLFGRMKELSRRLPSDSGSAEILAGKERRTSDLKDRMENLFPALETLMESLKNFWLNQENLKADLDEMEEFLMREPPKQPPPKQKSPEKKQKKKRGKKGLMSTPPSSDAQQGPSGKDLEMLEVSAAGKYGISVILKCEYV